jgi:hypothetical protein
MNHQPTCPECGSHSFTLCVVQLVDVKFNSKDDHDVCDGPRGDMEWTDETAAICTACGHAGNLKEMQAEVKYALLDDTLCQGLIAAHGDIFDSEEQAVAELKQMEQDRLEADMDESGMSVRAVFKLRDGSFVDCDGNEPITLVGEEVEG